MPASTVTGSRSTRPAHQSPSAICMAYRLCAHGREMLYRIPVSVAGRRGYFAFAGFGP
ncbi:MAG: hypothetical protein H0W83_11710 [Planctomycetes bacterium]|nr:hypothetical protein [Planctomycetota bacterium]